jgi:hypothetical protein
MRFKVRFSGVMRLWRSSCPAAEWRSRGTTSARCRVGVLVEVTG